MFVASLFSDGKQETNLKVNINPRDRGRAREPLELLNVLFGDLHSQFSVRAVTTVALGRCFDLNKEGGFTTRSVDQVNREVLGFRFAIDELVQKLEPLVTSLSDQERKNGLSRLRM